jgi:hypothetical protein
MFTTNGDTCWHGSTGYKPASFCPVCHPQSRSPSFSYPVDPTALEARVIALEARLAEIERRLAGGVTTTVGSVTKPTCPHCGYHDYSETGNILTSMPPQTEVKCKNCHRTWGIVSWGLR